MYRGDAPRPATYTAVRANEGKMKKPNVVNYSDQIHILWLCCYKGVIQTGSHNWSSHVYARWANQVPRLNLNYVK